MRKRNSVLVILGGLWLASAAALWACTTGELARAPSPTAIVLSSTATPTPTLPVAPTQWIKVDLPANATQLQFGAEVYRPVCQDCHGDKGQGLTGEWRATWAPADQNC